MSLAFMIVAGLPFQGKSLHIAAPLSVCMSTSIVLLRAAITALAVQYPHI
jgi:hypothetical protein